jgi:hypothetical protein
MIFGPGHYVPVLKVKWGEKTALQDISVRLRPRITPLLEIVEWNPQKATTLEGHLDTAFKNLEAAVSGYRRCLLDAREIEPGGAVGAAEVFERARRARIRFTPVTGLSRKADIGPALKHKSNGIGLRVTRRDFEEGGLTQEIGRFLEEHRLTHSQVDLIVDLGEVDDFVYDGVARLAKAFIGAVPQQSRWRTLTLSACSFPMSMGVVERYSHCHVDRNEWMVWRNEFYEKRASLERLPTFSDCGIQHPRGVEGFDPRRMQVSATIRYTLPERWLLIKGEGTRFNPPSQQFPELARRLVYGTHRRDYLGPEHCYGCARAKDAADGAPRLGSAGVWRRLGTAHHLTVSAKSLSQLSWP